MYYILIVGGHYVVTALTKSSELLDEKPLNIKNDHRLNSLKVHSFIESENANFVLTIIPITEVCNFFDTR